MPPVNPTIQPQNAPSYGNNSRPVDVPESIRPRGVDTNTILPEGQKIGDRSAEFEGQAAAYGSQAEAASTLKFGELFSDIAKIGDFAGKAGVELVKKDIENRVYDVANKEREDYTARLEAIKQGVGTRNILGPTPIQGESGEPPEEVQALGDRLDSLAGARDAGKITQTYYQGRLLAEAKDLRARYPGFREEIDAAFTKVTGSNPANAYVRDLATDINRSMSQTHAVKNQTLKYLEHHLGDDPRIIQLYQGIATDAIPAEAGRIEAVKILAPHEQIKVGLERNKALMEDNKLGREEQSYRAGVTYETAASVVINKAVTDTMNRLGITDANSVRNVNEGLQTGAIDPKVWNAEGDNMQNRELLLRQALIRAADENGVTAKLKGGKKELLEKVDASLDQFRKLKERVYAKDAGGLYSLQKDMMAMHDQDKRDLLGDTKAGPMWRIIDVAKDIGGQNYMKDLNLKMMLGDAPERSKEWYSRWSGEISTQTNYGPNGKPSTFKDMFDEMKRKGVDVPKASKAVLDQVGDISNPKTPDAVKENIALAAFSPGNRGFVSMLNPDGVDSRGRQVTGQNYVFQKWTSPEITREMKKLGEKNPEVWKNYIDWNEYTLGKELLPREIANLKSVGEDKNIKVSWDSDNKRFDVKYIYTPRASSTGNVLPVDPWSYPPYALAKTSLNRINSSLSNYKNVAEASGGDVDTFLLKTIRTIGGDLSNVSGIPAQMLQEIDNTRNFQGRFGASQRQQ